MKKNTWLWMILSSLIFVVLVYFSWQKFGPTNVSAKILSKQAAQKLVQDRYQGTVIQIRLADRQYHIEFEKEQTHYNIDLDAVNGKVLSFTKIGTKSPPSTIDENSNKLTETEAKEIAKKHVNGVVDQIWLETNEKQTFYLVEIETQDDREAIVQIHAITGNVMSVSWDDHSNDDSKNRSTDDDKNDDSKHRDKDDKQEDDD